MALNKEELLALGALKPRLVSFEFDGVADTVWIKPQSALEFQQEMVFIKSLQTKAEGDLAESIDVSRIREVAAYKVARQLVDEVGEPLLTEQEALMQSNGWLSAVEASIRNAFKADVADTAKK